MRVKNHAAKLIAVLMFTFLLGRLAAAEPISLSGAWAFRLDPDAKGIDQGWWEKALAGGDTIALPGSTDQGKKGPGNTAAPNLDFLYRLYPYVGAAWYQREIDIPEAWKGKRVELLLERCHWETRVWIDEKPVGMQDSLCVAHVHDLGILAPGKHRLTLRVDNSHKYDMGKDAHSTSDQTQTNWNGVTGKIELRAKDPVWIEEIRVTPQIENKRAVVHVRVRNATGAPVNSTVTIEARCGDHRVGPITATYKDGSEYVSLPFALSDDQFKLWDEFSPNLYTLTAKLTSGATLRAESSTTFGMRQVAVDKTNKQITLNGRPFYVRGTLDCCIYPKTGYPPTDLASWQRIIKICQSYGLNHIRFHSWCPPEAAFAAADQLGFTFQVELPCWIHNYASPGMEPRDRFLRDEMHRILDVYGNHPSFLMLCMGNEPGPRDKLDFIHGLVKEGKQLDPRRLYMSGSGWGFGPDDDYHVSQVRGLKGPKTDHDFRDQDASHDVPVVSHEIGQWTIYPNFEEMKKYDGVVRAKNFELVRDDLQAKGMLGQAADFTRATGLLMVQLYKEEIEVLLRTPGHGGFQLLDLHDFPGQGTALIGTLDPFWDSKGLIKPEKWREFCGPVVPLIRMPKRTYTTDEPFVATAEVAQFGPADLKHVRPYLKITDDQGNLIDGGVAEYLDLPTGKLSRLGGFSLNLAKAKAPAKLTATLQLEGTDYSNSWNIWVYPPKVDLAPPAGVFIARAWDDEAKQKLAAGGKVLLLARGNSANSLPGSFTPVFWSPVWFKRGAGTMSILCDPAHPALASFPTSMQTDWQWADLLTRSRTLILDDLPRDFRPVVQMIDNFARNHRLGNLLEAKVGNGRLMVCSIDLSTDMANRPEARQFLRSILDYMGSDANLTRPELKVEDLDKLLAGRSSAPENIARVSASSAQPEYEADKALDGDPETFWHTAWTPDPRPFPHELTVELAKPVKISSVGLLPRQDNNRNGYIKECELYASADGKAWGEPAAKASFKRDAEKKTLQLAKPVEARFLRLRILSGFDAQTHASLAELTIQ